MSSTRVDAVWDQYEEKSLKNQTHVKRIGNTRDRPIRAADNIPMQKVMLGTRRFTEEEDKKEEKIRIKRNLRECGYPEWTLRRKKKNKDSFSW